MIAKKMEKIEKKTHFVHLLQNSNSYMISLHMFSAKKTATTAHVGKKKAKNAN